MSGFMGLVHDSQGDKMGKLRSWMWFFLIGVGTGTLFTFYLGSLYNQLTAAFSQADQYIPTRIYSDLTRIEPLQSRGWIEEKLKNLGYTISTQENQVSFSLHAIDYPLYLIPDNHPTLDAFNQPIRLSFDGKHEKALLRSIEIANHPVSDLYLEPELVATLSRSGEARKEIRTPLKFDEIPANVWKAIIAIEDQHFLEHKGLDPRGILRAVWVNLKTLSLAQGGSTITQQLVKNLMARRTKNIFRKINELFLALLLEIRFEKEQILERYLNEVYLGQIGGLETRRPQPSRNCPHGGFNPRTGLLFALPLSRTSDRTAALSS
jgi:penicillin-binding protein 1B